MNSNMATIIKRTSTIVDDGPVIAKKNYQVYRGMSPTTASRLEQRLKELEEALEHERDLHTKTERDLADAQFQLDAYNEKFDETDNQLMSQADIQRKKDQEIQKLRKDLELLNIQQESNESSLKKRHQDIVSDLTEQLERITKQKSKIEKDKMVISIEIDNLNANIDTLSKAKNYAESKLEGFEDQSRKQKSQLDDALRINLDLKSQCERLNRENNEFQHQLHDFELNSGNTSKIKIQLQHQLDETKAKYDEEHRNYNQLEIQFNNMQIEYDKLHAVLDDESDSGNSLRSQNQKLQQEYTQLKSRYDKDLLVKTEELDDIRRKMNARIAELESLAEQARNKAAKFEKDKNKLTIDIRDYTAQLDDANAGLNEYAKRLKQVEHVNNELQKRSDDLGGDLHSSNSENQKLLAEMTRLKTLSQDQQAKIDALNREVAKLTEAFRESESSNKELSRNVQELTSIRLQIQVERDALLSELADVKDSNRDLQARLDSSGSQLNTIRSEYEIKIRDKDEEIENQRRNGQRSSEELQRTIFELETKYKNENGRLKKKCETENHDILIQIDTLNRNNGELAKSNKNLGSRLREIEGQLESERQAASSAKDSVNVLERKIISLQTELNDSRLLFENADKARKHAQDELLESSSRIQEINITLAGYANEKRRIESEFGALQREYDDALHVKRTAEDRADNLQLEMTRLGDQLSQERDRYSQSESSRKQLEIQFKEISIRLEESESSKDGKKQISKMQSRIHDLEVELDNEQRRYKESFADARKYQKLYQELKAQSDEEHRLVQELSDQVTILQNRYATLKRQFEEQEEVLSITMGKYRKTQQQLEEAERKTDRADKNISIVRHSTTNLPRPGGGLRSISVSREITKSSRI